MLKRRGYSVLTAHDGRDGLQRVVENKFDVIICDIYMPEMNGVEFLKRIRSIDPNADVIMMSSYPSDELREEIEDKRVIDFLAKPFTIVDIVNSLAKAKLGHKN
jgi:CheY-like chemotaxis protein